MKVRGHMKSAEGGSLVERIDAAITAMNELVGDLGCGAVPEENRAGRFRVLIGVPANLF